MIEFEDLPKKEPSPEVQPYTDHSLEKNWDIRHRIGSFSEYSVDRKAAMLVSAVEGLLYDESRQHVEVFVRPEVDLHSVVFTCRFFIAGKLFQSTYRFACEALMHTPPEVLVRHLNTVFLHQIENTRYDEFEAQNEFLKLEQAYKAMPKSVRL